MSKIKKNLTTTPTITTNINKNSNNLNKNNEFENTSIVISQNSFINKKNPPTITINNNSQLVKPLSSLPQMKKRTSKAAAQIINQNSNDNSLTDSDFSKSSLTLPSFYCISINQDGYRNMDRVSHLNEPEIESKNLEYQLRPISGIRNHLKRNLLSSSQNFDVVKETDLIQRIGSIKTLKRLDLSFNNLKSYPKQLCELALLESLNLTGNSLTENDISAEWEKYQNLIEVILDSNLLKKIPKYLTKCKKLLRLSFKNNEIADLKHVESFKKLKYLILDYNSITTLEEPIRQLEKLEILYLSHNLIQNIQSSLFKSSLQLIKQIDLSHNKLQSISTELFMLPHLELLNLSNNMLTKLPSIPMTYFRTLPIFYLDLSSNCLMKFYDYLLSICKNIDLSSNRIRAVPSRSIQKLTDKQLSSKNLKLENNPLIEPPHEVCINGLKYIKEYFDHETQKLQINKGFKIVLLGESKSGKTSIACALEDFNSQTNQIEQFNVNDFDSIESKFIEIHEFNLNPELEVDTDYEEKSDTIRPGSSSSTKSQQSRSSSSKIKKKLTIKPQELNAFSNITLNKLAPLTNNITSSENNEKKPIIPVTVYDFNGQIDQFGHLIDLFIDKSALFILCIDSKNFIDSESNLAEFEKNFFTLLDLLLLKMNKNNQFSILPVLTKIDKIPKTNSLSKKQITTHIETLIKNYLSKKLADIKEDLKEIEKLNQITASQSDRLKQLVQTQSNLTPDVYKRCISISSIRMEGISQLYASIKEIILSNNKKNFNDVNVKIPAFWAEVEQFACNQLSEIPHTKLVDDKIKVLHNTGQQNLSILCVEYDDYRSKIVEKYGMSHLVDQITRYLHSTGKLLWYQDSDKMKKKVFLRPNIFFELFFVLFRSNFSENFTDVHKQTLRSKLVSNTNILNEDNLKSISNEYLKKGLLSIDLLKLLWFPILITDSVSVVQEVFVIFSELFLIGYPSLSKDKLKIIYQTGKNDFDTNLSDSVYSSFILPNQKTPVPSYNSIVVPFYLPFLLDQAEFMNTKRNLEQECLSLSLKALTNGLKKVKQEYLNRISQKYYFPWSLLQTIFDKFSVNCLINSDLYFKLHYKNCIYALNEENTIGVLIHSNSFSNIELCNEVIFEFYLINYPIDNNLEQSSSEFEQTTEMDMDQIWLIAQRVLQLFEETINFTYPSLRYDRYSMCPSCSNFSFFGEWNTPKELQKLKFKTCSSCQKNIHYSFLVKPSTGQSLTLDMKRMQQRLEKLAKLELKQFKLTNTNQSSSKESTKTNQNKKL